MKNNQHRKTRIASNPLSNVLLCSMAGLLPVAAGTIVVTTADDQLDAPGSGGLISLREAIRDAPDEATTIEFDESLSGAIFALDPSLGSLIVADPDAGTSPTDTGRLTFDATGLASPPRISSPTLNETSGAALEVTGRSVRLRNMVIENASHQGIRVDALVDLQLENVDIRHCDHAAIWFQGFGLYMTECEIHGNIIPSSGLDEEVAAVWFDNGFTLSMNACSIYQNAGRGILCEASSSFGRSADLTNLTIAENSPKDADTPYGGISINGSLATEIRHCTIVDNAGGGLGSTSSNTRAFSSIIARNYSRETGGLLNLSDNVTSRGYNLSDDSPAALDHLTDKTNQLPRLSRIGYYGGHAPTCYPLVGSPALSAANAEDTESIDGRGYPREISTSNNSSRNLPDIGAVEVNTSTSRSLNVVSTTASVVGSLQNRLDQNTVYHHRRITFDASMSGQTFLFENIQSLANDQRVVVDASALEEPIILETGGLYSGKGSSLSLINVVLSDFNLTAQFDGSIGLNCAEVTDTSVNLTSSGRMLLNECEVHDTTTSGTYSVVSSFGAGHLQVWNSTFSNNAKTGEAHGAAILSTSSKPSELFNVTFDGNQSNNEGAAIYHEGDLLVARHCSVLDTQSSYGAFAFGPTASSRVTGCLFAGNQNSSNSSFDADVLIPSGSEDRHDFFWNWTTAISPRPDGFEAGSQNQIGADVSLRELGDYGGKVPSRPQTSDSGLLGIFSGIPARALDAIGQVPEGIRPVPGAVTETQNQGQPFASIDLISVSGNTATLTISRTPGSAWILYTGEAPNSLSATSYEVPSEAAVPVTLNVLLPSPHPEQYFMQLEED
ncbi:right-handed parallel beta-helix repeat-containing protein [Roseibacillus persicicus]|uniref:Right handed beta helix domain-containing protein n=1 Tax=Roseibacillus persicicus TaxID=454148 RepID=A0A918WM68_9BACT|nr:right-handed parallel beta-helix repeat-containing protein [Roseibacillus persicicus]GHC63080.1 hypothetical protein GCM10007100_33140 [Roseibacillus persicicus]